MRLIIHSESVLRANCWYDGSFSSKWLIYLSIPNNIKLQTERLFLRKFTLDDAAFVYTLMNSPGWLRFIGDRDIKSHADAKQYIQDRFFPTYQETGCGFWCVLSKNSNEAIGTVSMLLRDALDEIDLGFAFLPESTGFGYAFEASQAILKMEQKDCNLRSVLAFTDLENARSQSLLERLGFSKIGLKVVKEEWGESLLYRLEF